MIKDIFLNLIRDYGNIGLAIGLILEFLGIPVPGETLMSLFGFMTREAIGTSIIIPVLFATAGTFIGSTIAYIIGFRYGEGVVLKLGKYLFITKEKLDKGNIVFNRYKTVFLLFGRFVPGIRHIVPYLSGIGRIDARKFLINNFFGAFIWSATFLGLGYFVGEKWKEIEKAGIINILIIVAIIIFIILAIKLFKKFKLKGT